MVPCGSPARLVFMPRTPLPELCAELDELNTLQERSLQTGWLDANHRWHLLPDRSSCLLHTLREVHQ